MDRPALMAIVVAFLFLLLALMYLGWRSRKRRQGGIASPQSAPVDPGRVLGEFDGKYVATTSSGDPLDRIAVHGLGFRATGSIVVTATGLIVRLDGGDEFWIPAADIRDVRRATWTIDRVVETAGLNLVEWRLGDRVLDSYFRLDRPEEFESAAARLSGKKTA